MTRIASSPSRTATRSLLALPPVLVVAALLMVACGGGGGGETPGATTPVDEAPFGLAQRPSRAALTFPVDNPQPRPVDLVRAFSNLWFDRPLLLTYAPDGSNRLYVIEQVGRVLVFENDDAVANASVVIDLRDDIGGPVAYNTNEEGLLGLCFDPAFATNGYFYVHYSMANPRRSRIARYRMTFPPGGGRPTASASSFHEILTLGQPDWNHNSGMLTFGPDGMLYIGFGDGGSGGDPWNNGQDTTTLHGNILRVDVRGSTTQQPYVVPPDNPYVGIAGYQPEIWAYGLRNPWRFSFDRGTGDLLCGDVGQGEREEIDLIVRGGNYGWRIEEGSTLHRRPPEGVPAGLIRPVVEYGHGTGTTVVGGYVYRGQDVPSLRGVYVYGDYGSGRIWGLTHDAGALTSNVQINSMSQVCSFGEDARGELYAVSLDGTIRRFTEPQEGVSPPPFPGLLSETGLFEDLALLTPASGVIPYDVNAPLYSDDARKQRWVALPDGTSIGFDATGAWTFPLGTVLVKHFELLLRVGDPASARRLETRVLVREQQGWAGYTYRWNQAQTDAVLLPDAAEDTFTIQDPQAPDGVREQTWRYPSRTDCMQCHTAPAGRVLGVRSGQLHRTFDYPDPGAPGQTITDNQLRAWNHIGLFTTDIGGVGAYEAWPDPQGAAGTPSTRARAYLATNCAQCHRQNGTAPGNLDLRWRVPDAAMNAINVAPGMGDFGLPSPRLIDPGARANSILWLRMQTLDSRRMPRLGSGRVHGAGLDVVGSWIDGM